MSIPKIKLPAIPAKGILTVIIIFAVVIGIFRSAFFSVEYGSVAILTRFGKIIGEPLQPGLHFKIPFVDKIVTYKTQKLIYETVDPSLYNSYSNSYNSTGIQISEAGYQDVAVDSTTKDGQQISIRYTVRFSINPDKIKDIANLLGTETDIVDKIVKTDSRIWVRNIPRNYSAYELYTGNIDEVSKVIYEKLEPKFSENGLILDEFGIRSINFQSDYVNAIEQKQIEKEKITTEEYLAQQEEFKKQAAITKAQGEAEAQKLQQQTLTDQLIKKMYIEKWDGKLPTTIAGDSSRMLISL